MEFRFKKENPDAEQRRKECDKIRNQFSEKIPIICEKDPKSNIRDIDKTKYLVPADLTVSQFSFMIRKRIEIEKEAAFFLLANGKHSITGDTLLSEIYERYKDPEDGFLYIAYASELTWGNNN
jgi:GABA(A) receptor-associated protein